MVLQTYTYKYTYTYIYAHICMSVIEITYSIISDDNRTGNACIKSSFPYMLADKPWLNLQNLLWRNLLSCLWNICIIFYQRQMYSSPHKEMKGHTKREDCILKLASRPFWSMEPQWRACVAPDPAEENKRIWLRHFCDTFSQLTQIRKRKYIAQWERKTAMYY